MSNHTPLYRALASTLGALRTCEARTNGEWIERHTERLAELCAEHLPSGSGFDCGAARVHLERSTPERLVLFPADFHHMDEHGSYAGWTEHEVIVTPSLAHGFNLRVTGRDRDGIKTYIADTFGAALSTEIAS